jgi:gamma-glutamyltranspeptidase/glutathione hydrolase/leukotriene-C4 hydrolase
VTTFYHGRKIITAGPPASGSVAVSVLNILEGLNLAQDGDTDLNFHRLVEGFKFGFAQRSFIGDPAFVENRDLIEKFMTKEYAAELRRNLSDVSVP